MTTLFPPPISVESYLILVMTGILATLIYVIFFFRKEKRNNPGDFDTKTSKTRNIMGRSQSTYSQTRTNNAMPGQTEKRTEKPVTFAREIPSEELPQVFGGDNYEGEYPDPDPDEDEVDLQDEESELQAHRTTDINDFATGATFDELRTTANLLQKPELQADEQKIVTDIAARLQQTDLWEKFTQAIPQANDKIAKMLDPSHRTTIPPATDWQSFDIRNFI